MKARFDAGIVFVLLISSVVLGAFNYFLILGIGMLFHANLHPEVWALYGIGSFWLRVFRKFHSGVELPHFEPISKIVADLREQAVITVTPTEYVFRPYVKAEQRFPRDNVDARPLRGKDPTDQRVALWCGGRVLAVGRLVDHTEVNP